MNKKKLNLVRPIPEEEIAAQLAEDPDTYEWTDEDWATVQTTQELFPETHEWALRQKKALEAGLIQRVTVTLDWETIAWFKAQTGEDGKTGGTRWLELAPHPGALDMSARIRGLSARGRAFSALGGQEAKRS